MSLEDLIPQKPWNRFSKKAAEKVSFARNAGIFFDESAAERGMRCIRGTSGIIASGNVVALYWLVDETDGVIVDAKFQVFGQAALIAAADTACELLIRKNYDQASRMSAELIDKHLRDDPDIPSFPEEATWHLNLVLEAIDEAVEKCRDIPLEGGYVSPVPQGEIGKEEYPGWAALSYDQKISVIEKVLNEDVRPYIELDEGGIEVQKLIDDREIVIAYQGACTSCFSAIGATLSTIQQIVQSKIHPALVVVPNLETLKF
jgi:NifU-like protein